MAQFHEKYSFYVAWSAEDREFAASFIEIPGLSGMGATIPDAITQLHEAFRAWLEVASEHKYDLPKPIQTDAPVPLVVVDRSHLGQDPFVTDLTALLPAELRPSGDESDADTSAGESKNIDFRPAA